MSKRINPTKKFKIKKALLEGKSGSAAMIEAGYSEATANHSLKKMAMYNSVVAEIKASLEAKMVSPEDVLSNLTAIRQLALEKSDLSTAKECEIWIGKYLAMFTDKSEVKSTPVNQIIITHDKPIVNNRINELEDSKKVL